MELLLECGHQAEVWIGKSTLCRSESVCPLWKIGDAVLTSYSRVVLQCNRTRRMMVGPLRVFLDSSIFPLILSIGPDHSQWLHGHHSKEIKVYLSSIKKLQTYPPPSDIPPPPAPAVHGSLILQGRLSVIPGAACIWGWVIRPTMETKGDIVIDATGIKRLIRDSREQLHATKLGPLKKWINY